MAAGEYTEEHRWRDIGRVKNALSVLSEHFDNVRIFVNYNTSRHDTRYIDMGAGNSLARVEQVRRWVDRIDMNAVAVNLDE